MMFALPAILQQQQEVIDPLQPRYCAFHKTPVFPVYQIPANPASIDPFWSNVTVYIDGIGTNGSNAIVDKSSSPKTLTVEGDEIFYSNQQSVYNNSSVFIGGTGGTVDRIRLLSYAENFVDYTIDFWFYPNRGTNSYFLLQGGNPALNIQVVNDVLTIGTNFIANARTRKIPRERWNHLAISRELTLVRVFLNGFLLGSYTTNTNPFNPNNSLIIGQTFRGYLGVFRLTKNVGRYTGFFNPNVAPQIASITGSTTSIDYYAFNQAP